MCPYKPLSSDVKGHILYNIILYHFMIVYYMKHPEQINAVWQKEGWDWEGLQENMERRAGVGGGTREQWKCFGTGQLVAAEQVIRSKCHRYIHMLNHIILHDVTSLQSKPHKRYIHKILKEWSSMKTVLSCTAIDLEVPERGRCLFVNH